MPKPSTSPNLSAARTEHRDVVCPFCSLLCDDLIVRADGAALRLERGGCARARSAFEASAEPLVPLVAGRPASTTDAVAAAARILRRSRQPLIAGLGTDVAGVRAALALAERCGAIVDHMHSAAMAHNRRVLQSRGWITTTLGELRNRADLVVMLGVDCSASFQNFFARFLDPPVALQPERRAARRVIELVPPRQKPAPTTLPVERIAVAREDLAQFVALVRARLRGRSVARGARHAKAAEALARALESAQYPVLVWAPGQLDPGSASLTVSAVCELVGGLNQSGRAAGLSLGGDDGGQTALSCCAWLTGFPLHVSFAGDTLEFDPEINRAERLLTEEAVDAVVHVSSFGARAAPPGRAPVIAVGRPGPHAAAAAVYLPAGIPGLDHAGQLVRTDAVVSMPLRALREPLAPPVAAVLEALAAALPERT